MIIHNEVFTSNVTNVGEYSCIINSSYPLSNVIGQSSSSQSKYARMQLNTGKNAESYVYYLFDASSIRSDAIITSVTCEFSAYSSSSISVLTAYEGQLSSGTILKGSPTSWNTSRTIRDIDGGTSWTRSELDDLRIRLYSARGSTNQNQTKTVLIYFATVTVNYYWEESEGITGGTLYLNDGGTWKKVKKIYKKNQSNNWVECDKDVLSTSEKYMRHI